MNNNETVALAIQTLLEDKKPISAAAISDLTGIRLQYIYQIPSFRPFVVTRKKNQSKSGPVTTYKGEDLKESIDQTEEGYLNFITDSYFFHPETVCEVKQDMWTSINSFDANIFNNAMMTLIRTGAVLEAKPRGKDDIARYVWAETRKVEVEAPAAPVAPPSLKKIIDDFKATEENPFHIDIKPAVKAPAKLIAYKHGHSIRRVQEATATLLHRIAEYVTDTGEDDPEILKLEEFARATLKKIQKVGA